jgi:hypothetical protein
VQALLGKDFSLLPVSASPSNANELLALKKIETYITNTTHLIDEAFKPFARNDYFPRSGVQALLGKDFSLRKIYPLPF